MASGADITFCFTDIVGSTGLLRRLGDGPYGILLDRHRQLVRGAVAASGGEEISTEGDGFFLVFGDVAGAATCAATIQRETAVEPWADGATVEVRVGIHRGAAERRPDGNFSALAVHQAARVVAAAHGGQVLLSDAAVEAATLPPGLRPVRLGRYRLRDFDDPVALFQLAGTGLGTGFPPVRAAPENHGLPIPRAPLVGRDTELRSLGRLVVDAPMVTLVGPGGVGKTRLALEVVADVAAHFDATHLVELSSVAEDALVPGAVASGVAVKPAATQTVEEALVRALRPGRILVILDGCERVLNGVAELVETLLRANDTLTIVATSTEAVRVPDERLFRVEPLITPAGDTDPLDNDAVHLLLQRANAAGAELGDGFSAATELSEIAQRLDGLPLALELAARRVAELGVTAVVTGLDDRFALLNTGYRTALPRHRTLEAMVSWTVELLDDDERDLLGRLACLSGRWPQVEVIDVVGLPFSAKVALDRLVERSLVDLAPNDVPRVKMLDSIRAFARRLVDPATADLVTGRALTALIERIAAYEGPVRRDTDALVADVYAALQDLRLDRIEELAHLIAVFSPWWEFKGLVREGLVYAEQVLALCPPGPQRTEALAAYARLQSTIGEHDRAAASARAVLERPEASRRAQAIAWSLLVAPGSDSVVDGVDPLATALALCPSETDGLALGIRNRIGVRLTGRGDLAGAAAIFAAAEADARAAGQIVHRIQAIINRGSALVGLGDLDAAERTLEEGSRLAADEDLGVQRAAALTNLAIIALHRGDLARAVTLAEERIELAERSSDAPGEAAALSVLSTAAIRLDDIDLARSTAERSIGLYRRMGRLDGVWVSVFNLAVLETGVGDLAAAARWVQCGFDERLADNRVARLLGIAAAASVGARHGDADAATLFGAISADDSTLPLDAGDRAWMASSEAVLAKRIGDDVVASRRASGATISLDEAVVLARAVVARLACRSCQ